MDIIDHIAIQVDDIGQAIDWYKTISSFKLLYSDSSWALLEYKNIKLALVIKEQHPSHLAISRKDASSFGKLKKHRDGTSSVYIKDTSNNVVEILKLES